MVRDGQPLLSSESSDVCLCGVMSMVRGAGKAEGLVGDIDEVLCLKEQGTGDIRSFFRSALLITAVLGDVPALSLSSSRLSAGLAGMVEPSLAAPPPKRSSSKASNSPALSLPLVGVSPEGEAVAGLASDRCGVMLLGHKSFICAADSFPAL